MKKLTIIIFLLQAVTALGNSVEDSLLTELASSKGGVRTEVLVNLSECLQRSNPAKAVDYAQEALISFPLDKASKLQFRAYLSLSKASRFNKDISGAYDFAQKALETARKIGEKKALADAKDNLGTIYFISGDEANGLENLKEALTLFKEIGDKKSTAKTSNNIGIIYVRKNIYDYALEYFLTAAENNEAVNDSIALQDNYTNLGLIYYNLGDMDRSLEYHKKALNLLKAGNDKGSISAEYINAGLSYWGIGDSKTALDYFSAALEISREMKNSNSEAKCLNNMGLVYEQMNRFEQALDCYSQALNIKIAAGDSVSAGRSYGNIGTVYLKMGRKQDALKQAKIALKIGEKNQAKDLLAFVYELLINIYVDFNKYKEAVDAQYCLREIEIEMVNEKSMQRIVELQTKYDTARKEKEIELLKKDNDIQSLEIDRQKTIRNFIGAGGVIFVILTGIILYSYVKRLRTMKLLNNAHSKLQKTYADLQEAAGKIKVLSGLVPICCNCKKIRNDQGYWEQLESYLGEHTDADITHGICPECARELYPNMTKK